MVATVWTYDRHIRRRGTRSTTRYDPAIGTGPNDRESASVTSRLSDSTDIVPSPCTSDDPLDEPEVRVGRGVRGNAAVPTRAERDRIADRVPDRRPASAPSTGPTPRTGRRRSGTGGHLHARGVYVSARRPPGIVRRTPHQPCTSEEPLHVRQIVRLGHRRPCPLRPVLRCLRPGPGQDRGAVGRQDAKKYHDSDDELFRTRCISSRSSAPRRSSIT